MTDAAELVKLADDLPARLRGLVEYGQSVALSDALEQAADEIERLRAAIAAQQDGAEVEALKHDIERHIKIGSDLANQLSVAMGENARLQAAMTWQPINTAPKDGTTILVCDATHMDSQKIVFWDVDPKSPPGFHWFVEDAGAYHEKAFTHWKPLDPQPT